MAAPVISLISVSRYKISDEIGFDKSTVIFQSDQDIVDWEARVGGIRQGTGILIGSPSLLYPSGSLVCSNALFPMGATANANTNIQFDVDYSKLISGDGTYRINIYAKNSSEEWTPYE